MTMNILKIDHWKSTGRKAEKRKAKKKIVFIERNPRKEIPQDGPGETEAGAVLCMVTPAYGQHIDYAL